MLKPINGVSSKPKTRRGTSKTPEGKVKDRIKQLLDDMGAWWFMPMSMGYSRSGVPDFITCHKGKFVGIEAKSNKTTHPLTEQQKKELNAISQAEGIALVIDETNVEDLETLITGATK